MDANVMIGHSHHTIPEAPAINRDELLRELDDRGVDQAIVHHAHGCSHNGRIGWELTNDFIAGNDRLIAQACAGPTDDDLQFVMDLRQASGLSSVRIASVSNKQLNFLEPVYGPLLTFLQLHQTPLWIDLWHVEFRDLIETMRRFPALPVVVLGAHYVHYVLVKPLLRSLPNAYLELSRYDAFGQVEELVREFGAGRLIYGSGFPAHAMGTMLFYLHHCPSISDEQLELICHGNVARLLQTEGMLR